MVWDNITDSLQTKHLLWKIRVAVNYIGLFIILWRAYWTTKQYYARHSTRVKRKLPRFKQNVTKFNKVKKSSRVYRFIFLEAIIKFVTKALTVVGIL